MLIISAGTDLSMNYKFPLLRHCFSLWFRLQGMGDMMIGTQTHNRMLLKRFGDLHTIEYVHKIAKV